MGALIDRTEGPADSIDTIGYEPESPGSSALAQLRTRRRFSDRIEAVHVDPPREARHGPWPGALSEAVRRAAEARGIPHLYSHQSAAVSAALAGRHVVCATGTASGKSLCYTLPTLDALVRDPGATALYLFPTKALAHDQLDELGEWSGAMQEIGLAAAAYDGDTRQSARPAVRTGANVVVTNPDMLHAGILPHHPRWERFFAGLKYVVVDEMHVYRGVFGGHVANVMRRLRRVAAHYGAAPTFILTSATIANPRRLGEQLAGAPVELVADDGSPRGQRALVFYNPPLVHEELNLRRSAVLESEGLARLFMGSGAQTIVFARTRQATELVVRYITDGLARTAAAAARAENRAGTSGQASAQAGAAPVRGYRGGYTATERREIEEELRTGRLQCVVATNALELGIDVGRLEACVMTGYPGSIASTWQQAGRAGRRGGPSVAVLVAGNDPLDQFIVRQPAYFFGRSPEHALIDPDNLLVLLEHVRCAAFELPFGPDEASAPFGATQRDVDQPGTEGPAGMTPAPPVASELLGVLEAQGTVRSAGGQWYWLADAYPAGAVDLRSAGGDEVAIVTRRESGADDALGTVPRSTAQVTVHEGAVYLHDGRAFHVDALDWEAGKAYVSPTDGALYTRASSTVTTKPVGVDRERLTPGALVACGELEITTRATAYRRIRFQTHETLGWGTIDLPELSHTAGAYWFGLTPTMVAQLVADGVMFVDSGDRGPEWPAIRAAVRERDAFRCRRCGAPERPDRGHDVHHMQPWRTFLTTSGAVDRERANKLDNLITLCRPCHRAAERAAGFGGALSGAAYALVHVASLVLMCDPRDLGVAAEVRPSWTSAPTIAVYERALAGAGFGATLFDEHEALLSAAYELVARCPCAAGCPSCVGVPEDSGPEGRSRALAVLAAAAGAGPLPPGA